MLTHACTLQTQDMTAESADTAAAGVVAAEKRSDAAARELVRSISLSLSLSLSVCVCV